MREALDRVRQGVDAVNAKGQPEWSSRLRAADIIFKLAGAYIKKPQTDPVPTVAFNELLEAILAEPEPVIEWILEHEDIPSEQQHRLILAKTVEAEPVS